MPKRPFCFVCYVHFVFLGEQLLGFVAVHDHMSEICQPQLTQSMMQLTSLTPHVL